MNTIDDALRYLIDKSLDFRIQGYTLEKARNAFARFLIYQKDNLTFDKKRNIIVFKDRLKDISKEDLK
jgi:hypothetical protein